MVFTNFSRQFSRVASLGSRELAGEIMNAYVECGTKTIDRPFRVSVEGNIGSGKTTLINYFQQFPIVQTYGEPLDKWRNIQGHNLLGLLYEDMTKWSATFQSYVQLTRMQIQSSAPKEGVKVQMFERSVQNNRFCFLENSYKSGVILPAQYAVLCKWYDWISDNVDIALDLIVYLKSDPEVVHKRVLKRNRHEEKGVTLKYLQSLHEMHENWLSDPNLATPVFVIDANASLSEIKKSYKDIIPTLCKKGNLKGRTTSESAVQMSHAEIC